MFGCILLTNSYSHMVIMEMSTHLMHQSCVNSTPKPQGRVEDSCVNVCEFYLIVLYPQSGRITSGLHSYACKNCSVMKTKQTVGGISRDFTK